MPQEKLPVLLKTEENLKEKGKRKKFHLPQ